MEYFEDSSRDRKITTAVLAAALSACATETVLLNSERIEQQFGSYGIDVLASEAGMRRSSLFSVKDEARICRTYAIVRFTDDPHTSYGPEHANVLAGNSLGEVFKSNGWSIHKQTLHIGTFELDKTGSEIAELMQFTDTISLSLHIYQLLLAKDSQVFEYATIIEAHHPDYLSQSDLLAIYHYDNSESLSASSLAELIELVTAKSGT